MTISKITRYAIHCIVAIPRSAIRNPQSNGFTLIETIITLVVLSIAMIGVLSVFTVGISKSANPVITDQAIQLAQEKMDIIMGDRLNSARGYGWITAAVNPYTAENPVTGFAGFSRSVNIYCVTAANLQTNAGAPPCASGYAHITVTVTNAAIGSVTADTVITNY
jgi:prepilin-type N-terminal cleavage/methylation domain-containing protein